MIDISDKKECCGCGACAQRCPKDCIRMLPDQEGFLYPQISSANCIGCDLCVRVCPVINQSEPANPLKVFAAQNKDSAVRMDSSSGGVVDILARNALRDGAAVFGAAFDSHWQVRHRCVSDSKGLELIRQSKYVQSQTGDTFSQCESLLKNGKKALYIGTPCQIAALKGFLGKDYKNLLTVDFVCHGVPSPGVWQRYLNEQTASFSGRKAVVETPPSRDSIIKQIKFRDKRFGWEKYSFCILTEKEKVSLRYDNPYMIGFLHDLYLRPSCHQCPSKSLKSHSDITVADCWSLQRICPGLDDDKGTNSVIINTPGGMQAFDAADAVKMQISYDDLKKYNSAITHSAGMNARRDIFFKGFSEGRLSVSYLVVHLCRSRLSRIKRIFRIFLCNINLYR